MEPSNELTAIFQKRKGRTEANDNDTPGGLTSANENVSPIKTTKSRFETNQAGNNVCQTGKPVGVRTALPPKPVNVSKGTAAVETKRKVSDIASKFSGANVTDQMKHNAENTDSIDSKQQNKTVSYGRQKSDMPLVSPKSKPISKIRSSPNISGEGHGIIPEESPNSALSSSQNVKTLRDNLFLTIDHNKRLSSGSSSPGSASPGLVMRSRSPTPGIAASANTPPPLRKKSPALPPKPSQGELLGEESKSEPGSKRSSSTSSDKSEDPIGERFVAALKKAGVKSFDSSGPGPAVVQSKTLPLPPKQTKPCLAKKPQVAKSAKSSQQASPGSPALPPKLAKFTDSASVNRSTSRSDTNSSASPALPVRTKKVPSLPKANINAESNSAGTVKTEPPSPPKRSHIASGVRAIDDMSRPIPPIKPTIVAQLSIGSDYYDDVEVIDYPPPEGDKDSGRVSTEGGVADVDKRSNGTGNVRVSSIDQLLRSFVLFKFNDVTHVYNLLCVCSLWKSVCN